MDRPLSIPAVADPRRWDAECGGKDPYPSESAANAALAKIKRDGNLRRTCWLESYQCGCCREWHLGNARKR